MSTIIQDSSGKVISVSKDLEGKGLEGKKISSSEASSLTEKKSSKKSSSSNNNSSSNSSSGTTKTEVTVSNIVVGAPRDESRPTQGIYRQLIDSPSSKPEYIAPRSSRRGEFVNSEGQGFSASPSLVTQSSESLGYGVSRITMFDESTRLTQQYNKSNPVVSAYGRSYSSSEDMFQPVKSSFEKRVIKVSEVVDYPVTKAKQILLNNKDSGFYGSSKTIDPLSSQKKVAGAFVLDVGSYFVPYYGSVRFAKDIGVYGTNVYKKPSYAVNEGKYETIGLATFGIWKGGSKAYSKFYRSPLTNEFGVIKQTSQVKAIERSVVREKFVRFTETNTEFVSGISPSGSVDLLADLKRTTILERPKAITTSFDISDKSLGVSRKGSRTLFQELDSGSSKIVDSFSVKRFNSKPVDYLRISNVSSSGVVNTRIFNVSKPSTNPILKFSSKSDNVSFTIGRGSRTLLEDSSLQTDRRLTSSQGFSNRQTSFVGDKNAAFSVTAVRSRVVSQDVKLSKYYSVDSVKELGVSFTKDGYFLAPIEKSKTTKNILEFGFPEFKSNIRFVEGASIKSSKSPTILENIRIKEDISLSYKLMSKSESKRLFEEYKGSFANPVNDQSILFRTKKFSGDYLRLSKNIRDTDYAISLMDQNKASPKLNSLYESTLIDFKAKKISGAESDRLRSSFGLFGSEEQSIAKYSFKQERYRVTDNYVGFLKKKTQFVKFTKPIENKISYLTHSEFRTKLAKSKKGSLYLNTQLIQPLEVSKPIVSTTAISDPIIIRTPKASISPTLSSFRGSSPSLNLDSPSSSFKFFVRDGSSVSSVSSVSSKFSSRVSPSVSNKMIVSPQSRFDVNIKQEVFKVTKPSTRSSQSIKQNMRRDSVLDSLLTTPSITSTIRSPKLIKTPSFRTKTPFKPIPFFGLTLPNRKSRSFSIPKFKSIKSNNNFAFKEGKYNPLASLSEVFKYEASSGREAGYTKSKKAKSQFENQLFGKGNFNSLIKVER